MAAGIAAPRAENSPRLVLWLLLIVYIFNFIDRQIVNILAEPIAKDLDLSDTQIGLMTGHRVRVALHRARPADRALFRPPEHQPHRPDLGQPGGLVGDDRAVRAWRRTSSSCCSPGSASAWGGRVHPGGAFADRRHRAQGAPLVGARFLRAGHSDRLAAGHADRGATGRSARLARGVHDRRPAGHRRWRCRPDAGPARSATRRDR